MTKITIHILAFFLKRAVNLKKIFTPIIAIPLKIMGRILFSALLPIYALYLHGKRILIKFYSPIQKKHRVIHFFARRYAIHILIIILALFVTTANLNANEIKKGEEGYNNILYHLIEKEDYNILQTERAGENMRYTDRYYKKDAVEKKLSLDYDNFNDSEPIIISSQGALVKPILSPIEAQMRVKNEIVFYEVQDGDTISDIAQKFGVSINTILWENSLSSFSIIRPRQKLTVLPVSGIRHKVARGDTISKIAKKYGADENEILEFNKLASAKDIRTGELLTVPGGRKPQEVKTAYAFRWTSPAVETLQKTITTVGKMFWPSACRRITQYYTWRHSGIDIACGYGNSVKAVEAGTVIKAQGGWNGGYGLMVVVDHGNSQSLYGHLSKILVKPGDTVEKGQTIANEGSTGRSTGPHVHLEIRREGKRFNPLSYVK